MIDLSKKSFITRKELIVFLDRIYTAKTIGDLVYANPPLKSSGKIGNHTIYSTEDVAEWLAKKIEIHYR